MKDVSTSMLTGDRYEGLFVAQTLTYKCCLYYDQSNKVITRKSLALC